MSYNDIINSKVSNTEELYVQHDSFQYYNLHLQVFEAEHPVHFR